MYMVVIDRIYSAKCMAQSIEQKSIQSRHHKMPVHHFLTLSDFKHSNYIKPRYLLVNLDDECMLDTLVELKSLKKRHHIVEIIAITRYKNKPLVADLCRHSGIFHVFCPISDHKELENALEVIALDRGFLASNETKPKSAMSCENLLQLSAKELVVAELLAKGDSVHKVWEMVDLSKSSIRDLNNSMTAKNYLGIQITKCLHLFLHASRRYPEMLRAGKRSEYA